MNRQSVEASSKGKSFFRVSCSSASADKELCLKAPAKLNLYLNISGKRRDGFHEISSIMERVSLFDQLRLALSKTSSIRLFCDQKELNNESNLAFKAASLIKNKFRIRRGLDIILKKNIPQGSGLGGASSDAAAVILGLNKLFRLNLSLRQLFLLGRLLGSDVNFFLSGAKFALAKGRGDRIYPIKSSLKLKHLLIFTGQIISTKQIYKAFSLQLTRYIDNAKLIAYGIEKKDWDLLGRLLFNSLTKPYLEVSAKGRSLFRALSKIENCPFFLSGSGSTISVLLNRPGLESLVKRGLEKLRVKTLQVVTF
ncbi:MAG: 4-(cytidine 5'-diphospho)-2-C-methyl-D-erythritol kinase [Candidatus Omnitrophica bacterium]|nr:4-(cytidine 5'-diphospho)-2-C-methyl-D-erythritol kinase [Candidatus Omnitrophota bacterium]